MFWFYLSTGLIGTTLMVHFLTKKKEIIRGILYLVILLLGGTLIVAGHYYPNVHVVDKNGIKTYSHYFPLSFPMGDGTKLKLHMDSTYVLNYSGRTLYLDSIHYTRDVARVGALVYNYSRDSVKHELIVYKTNEVAAFKPAPKTLSLPGDKKTFVITQISLPDDGYDILSFKQYRLLQEPEDTWIFNYSNL